MLKLLGHDPAINKDSFLNNTTLLRLLIDIVALPALRTKDSKLYDVNGWVSLLNKPNLTWAYANANGISVVGPRES